jgi:hypothetical protein
VLGTQAGQVVKAQPSLNPQPGPGLALSVLTDGLVDAFEVKLYNRAFVVVGSATVAGPFGAGWQRLSFNLNAGPLPLGAYFYRVTAYDGAQKVGNGATGLVYILR